MKSRELKLNRPQLLTYLIQALVTVNIWGRGTGKSTGSIAPRMHEIVTQMPQSGHIIGAATYAQLLERTLPPVITALEQWGWYRDVNYTFGKQPVKAWKWPKPNIAPLRWDHTFYFNTGTTFQLISQDRPGSANGLSVISGIFDEAKYLNKKKHDEEIGPIFRGQLERYGEHHLYGGLLYCSDMPTMREGMWLLEMEKKMKPEVIDNILSLVLHIKELKEKLPNASEKYRKRLEGEIRWFEAALQLLRKTAVYYSEASAMENLAALGKDYIRRMRRQLPPAIFRTSILNERLRNLETSFYPSLNETDHTYQAKDNSYLDSLGENVWEKEKGIYTMRGAGSAKLDADVDRKRPFDIALDYGGHFNCLVVGQEGIHAGGKAFRTLNKFYVKPPDGIEQLVDAFCHYYRMHGCKEVDYYTDHTAIAQNPTGRPHNVVVTERFEKNGWTVRENYFGKAPSHQDKHQFWHEALQGLNPQLPWFLWNRDNCDDLLTSMADAGVRQGRNGFEKDKTSEDPKKGIPQEHATHLSDAMDMLAYYKYRKVYVNEPTGNGGLFVF